MIARSWDAICIPEYVLPDGRFMVDEAKKSFKETVSIRSARAKFNKVTQELWTELRFLHEEQRDNFRSMNQNIPCEIISGDVYPTDEERAQLKQFISLYDTCIVEYEQEIVEIEAHLHWAREQSVKQQQLRGLSLEYEGHICKLETYIPRLRKEQTAYRESAQKLRQLISPIRSLPVEILYEISLACVDQGRTPTLSRSEAPFSLTQISSIFRQIALSTPSLWTALDIDLGVFKNNKGERDIWRMYQRVQLINRWLTELSNDLPLSISLSNLGPEPAGYDGFYARFNVDIIGIVIGCCTRWRSVKFENVKFDHGYLKLLNEKEFPLLQSLELRYSTTTFPDITRHASNLFRIPTITNLTIQTNAAIAPSSFMLRNITTLSVGSRDGTLTIEFFCLMLRGTTTLVDCHLEICSEEMDNGFEVSLPSLLSLSIKETSDRIGLPGIVQYIIAPVLGKLVMTGEGHACRQGELTRLLRSSPVIREMHLEYPEPPDQLINCLRNCSSLEVLHLGLSGEEKEYTASADVLLHSLIDLDKKEQLCPALQVLRCVFSLDVSEDTLEDLFTLKSGNGSNGLKRWKEVELRVCSMHKFGNQVLSHKLVTFKDLNGVLSRSICTVNSTRTEEIPLDSYLTLQAM